MRLSTKVIGALVVLVILASVISDQLASRDPALTGAKDFASTAPEVVAIAGAVESTRTLRFLSYQGVPGKEEPYRQYQLSVVGSRGSANVTVRAARMQPEGKWNYTVVSVKR